MVASNFSQFNDHSPAGSGIKRHPASTGLHTGGGYSARAEIKR